MISRKTQRSHSFWPIRQSPTSSASSTAGGGLRVQSLAFENGQIDRDLRNALLFGKVLGNLLSASPRTSSASQAFALLSKVRCRRRDPAIGFNCINPRGVCVKTSVCPSLPSCACAHKVIPQRLAKKGLFTAQKKMRNPNAAAWDPALGKSPNIFEMS